MPSKVKRSRKQKVPALRMEIIRSIKKDPHLVSDIITATNKSYPTVMRWLDDNSEQLTQIKCLNVICDKLKKTHTEVLAKAG